MTLEFATRIVWYDFLAEEGLFEIGLSFEDSGKKMDLSIEEIVTAMDAICK